MGWAVRVAPGVRVALTPRGVRTSIGPRGARLHVGAGRTTISTGAGPVTLWTGVGHARRRPRPTRSVASHERQLRAAGRAQQLADTQALEETLAEHFLSAHLREVHPAQPPVVPVPKPADEQTLRRSFEHEALGGISWFRRAQRRQAREQARRRASEEAARENELARSEHEREQARADEQWRALLANDPQTVVASLESVFEHDQTPAAALDCSDAHATVLLRFPPPEGVVPPQQSTVTPTGRPTVKARTKSDTNYLYAAALFSHSLAVGREALASCPGLAEVAVVAVTGGEDATSPLAPICVMRIDRATAEQIDWSRHPEAGSAALRFERLMLIKGQAAEVSPLSLADQEQVRALVEEVAQHLGVPVDPRARQPLQQGQTQHFAPSA